MNDTAVALTAPQECFESTPVRSVSEYACENDRVLDPAGYLKDLTEYSQP
jgi:hypothetical protein